VRARVGDVLLVLIDANSGIVFGPPNTDPVITGFGKTFDLIFTSGSDNALNTRFRKWVFRAQVEEFFYEGNVLSQFSAPGWNATLGLMYLRGVPLGGNGATATRQTASDSNGASDPGPLTPVFPSAVLDTSSIVALGLGGVGSVNYPYTVLWSGSNLFMAFRPDAAYPALDFGSSVHSLAAVMEIGPDEMPWLRHKQRDDAVRVWQHEVNQPRSEQYGGRMSRNRGRYQ
jgi:hypothetical protein